jgi:general secretion pathway protein A
MLYLYHYGLKEKPFQETANPKFLWLGTRQLQTYGALTDGVIKTKGITLLTGAVGTGKTALLNYLAESFKSRALISRIDNPDLDSPDFLNSLADSMKLGPSFEDRVSFLSRLISAGSNKKLILIMIDEAHLLTQRLLEELSLLLKIKKNGRRMVHIVMAAQEIPRGSFHEAALAEMMEVAPQTCRLHPFTKEETEQYISFRLKIAGAGRNLFTPSALGKIYLMSGGIPRVINSVCDHALLTGYSKNLGIIGAAVIEECAQDFFFIKKEPDARKESMKGIPQTQDLQPWTDRLKMKIWRWVRNQDEPFTPQNIPNGG